MNRRDFLKGIIAAPFVITTPGLLMPVRKLWTPVDGGYFMPTDFVARFIRVMTIAGSTGSVTARIQGSVDGVKFFDIPGAVTAYRRGPEVGAWVPMPLERNMPGRLRI